MTPIGADVSRRLRSVAVRAAWTSARYLKGVFRTDMRVEAKGNPFDLVTEHDTASEELLRRVIFEDEPDSTVRGEEGGAVGTGAITWHVDPIDGTVNFASGIAFWCVSVAAELDGLVVAGAIVDPMSGTEFSVDVDGFRVDGELRTRRAAAADENGATVICTFPRFLDLEANGEEALSAAGELARRMGSVRAMGSGALGLAHVAAGWADATFDMHTNPWDVAAGALMVRATQGRYVGFEHGAPDADPRTSFRRRSYYAVGPGVRYPTLESVVQRLSSTA